MGVLAPGDSDSDGELADEVGPIRSSAAVPNPASASASGMWQRQVRVCLACPPPPAPSRRLPPFPCSPLPTRLVRHG